MKLCTLLYKYLRKKTVSGGSGKTLTPDPKKDLMEFPDILPQADKTYFGLFKSIGNLHNNTPRGVTVHYTANDSISATVNELSKKKLGYHFIIERDGTIYQCAGMGTRLAHAGRARWRDTLPNLDHIGVSLVSWGRVDRLSDKNMSSWCNRLVPKKECLKKGKLWWHVATDAQKSSLRMLLKKLVSYGLPPENICGHDECCIGKGRKIDPGGVIDVPEIRDSLVTY